MLRAIAFLLTSSVVLLAWTLGGGLGLGYVALYALLVAPGLPIGFFLFGSRHPAGWIAGALIGYGLTAIVLWLPVDLGLGARAWLPAAWAALTAATFVLHRVSTVLVQLPAWHRADTIGLLSTLLIVPMLVAVPFSRIGERDADGNQRYRAYFTADFLWHIALGAELQKAESPVQNPYLAGQPLHYYWAYFVPPAVIARAVGAALSLQACLLLNALCAGLLFVSAIYLYSWTAIPRAGPAAWATSITVLAASVEGIFGLVRVARDGQPLSAVQRLNIDAMTSWVFQGLTIDSLPRSLWYTPQHAAACAFGLLALITIVASRPPVRALTGVVAGLPLGLAIIFSPFLGGIFCVLYGLSAVWSALAEREHRVWKLASRAAAGVPALAGLGWCLVHGTFEGAGGSIVFGVSERASQAPIATLALAAGPVLVLAAGGALVSRGVGARRPLVIGPLLSLALFYFVTLSKEPVWVGWRAGRILLVTTPPLIALFFASLVDSGRRWLAVTVAVAALVVGLPTTLIDAWNAQDVENLAMGPGFRWTVVVSPDTQAAMNWIRTRTPSDAVVQMSVGPRGRETWTLIPTFAERRMSAGRPISLLHHREYDQLSNEIDNIYRTTSAPQACRQSRAQGLNYLYLDDVERRGFGPASIAKFDDSPCFTRVFRQGSASVFAVRSQD